MEVTHIRKSPVSRSHAHLEEEDAPGPWENVSMAGFTRSSGTADRGRSQDSTSKRPVPGRRTQAWGKAAGTGRPGTAGRAHPPLHRQALPWAPQAAC